MAAAAPWSRFRIDTVTDSRPTEVEPASASWRDPLVAILVIATATVLVYSNSFDASFHFDDMGSIVENEGIRDLSHQWPPSGSRWLGVLSFALNYRLGGLEVFGYHAVNVLVHVCNGLLVAWLAAITLRTPAMRRAEAGQLLRRLLPVTAGLLFALHPVATQAVTYIVQRVTSLATLFYLLSLALHARGRLSLEAERPSRARAACLYSLSVVAAAAAMKTKEISFTLPIVAVGYELLFFRSRKRLLLLAPLAATALLVPAGLATHGQSLADVLGGASRFPAETQEISRSVYLLTQSRVVVTYLRLLLLPFRQNLDYDFPLSHSLAEPDVLLALAILVAIGASAVLLLVRCSRANRAAGMLVFFGIAWFFVTLSVESSIVPIRDVIFEHRVYLPAAGAGIALGTALLWIVERLHLPVSLPLQAAAALLITAGPLGVATYARNLVWKDELTLWSDVVAKSPRKSGPHNNLALTHQAKGQLDDAIREFREAIRLEAGPKEVRSNVGLAELHDNLGLAYRAKGRLDDAIREHREAIRLDPSLAAAHVNIALSYEGKGELDDAMREYLEAIRLDPGWAKARLYLGRFLTRLRASSERSSR